MKEFTGVLVSRKYRPGQTYIQLLFKTADDVHLCLSRNIQMVKGLRLGQTYQVQGQSAAVGTKECLRDPVATLVQSSGRKRRVWIASGAICLTLLLGAGGVFAIQSGGDQPSAPAPKFKAAGSEQTLAEQAEESQQEPAEEPPSTDQQAAGTTTPATSPTYTAPTSTRSTTTRSTRSSSRQTPQQPTTPGGTTSEPPQQQTPPVDDPQPQEPPDPPEGETAEPPAGP